MSHPNFDGFVLPVVLEVIFVHDGCDCSGLQVHFICEIQFFGNAVSVIHVHRQVIAGGSGGIITHVDQVHSIVNHIDSVTGGHVVGVVHVASQDNLARQGVSAAVGGRPGERMLG